MSQVVIHKPLGNNARAPRRFCQQLFKTMLVLSFCLAGSIAWANSSPEPLADPGDRLILVGTQLSEIVFALDAGHRVAATHGYRGHIPGIDETPAIQGFGPAVRSAETLLSFRPTAIWFMDGRIDEPTLARLRTLDIPLEHFPNSWTLDEVSGHIASIALALNRSEKGQQLIGRFEAEKQALEALPILNDPPTAIFILAGGNRPMLTAGRDSNFQRLMDLAGGQNASTHRGFQLLSAEEMVRIAPDIIFLLDEALPPDRPPIVADLPGLRLTPAARAGRFREIAGHCLSDFGINTPACATRLRTALEQPDSNT